jgi:hypothetical protein
MLNLVKCGFLRSARQKHRSECRRFRPRQSSATRTSTSKPITGFAVKAGTPRPIVDRLNAELLKVLKSPDVISRIEAFGFEVVTGTPEEFSETLAADRGMYSRLVKEIDLKMN